MSESETIELGPNDQKTISFEVDDATDVLLVSMRSSEHQNVSTFPTWLIGGEQFPDEEQPVTEYPARLEPLGDELELKIRSDDAHQSTEVVVGFREKKLVAN